MNGWLKKCIALFIAAGLALSGLASTVLHIPPALADDDGGDGDGGGGDDGGDGDGGDDGGDGGGGDDGGGDAGDGGGAGGDGDDRDDDDHDDHDDDHEEAYERRSRGELSALTGVLREVRSRFGGRILDVKLTRRNGKLYYEIKILDRTGHVREISVRATRSVRTNFTTRRQIDD